MKLNIPMQPGWGDKEFLRVWEQVLDHVRRLKPEFIVMQCGADSLAGDPLAHLQYTPAAHAHAAKNLCALANEVCGGRIMGFGGGGYNRGNLAGRVLRCSIISAAARAVAGSPRRRVASPQRKIACCPYRLGGWRLRSRRRGLSACGSFATHTLRPGPALTSGELGCVAVPIRRAGPRFGDADSARCAGTAPE